MEEIERVVERLLDEKPEIVERAILRHPEIIYDSLAKISPFKDLATKDDIRRLEEKMATKEDLSKEVRRLEEKMATKEDLARLERRLVTLINGLGARWGLVNEEAFREGIREILREAGWEVEAVVLKDEEGYVYGSPSDVEYDVTIKDGAVMIVEITASLRRSDIQVLVRKRELFERLRNTKVGLHYVVTPFISDRYPEKVKEMARARGLIVVYPTPER
ncbi:MAG: DUF3782 domain-containing protein [Conexivisphaera sp.]